MNHVFVGDIHGKVERVEEALAKDGKIIFVGDFMDSFTRARHEQAKCIDLVCDAIEKGKARSIYGNHELSYLYTAKHRCSGYTSKGRYIMMQKQHRVFDLFEPYIMLGPKFLVTHAGLTKIIWQNQYLDSLETQEDLEKVFKGWWDNLDSPMHWIGGTRGGGDPDGGMFWCDFNFEFEPVPGLTQVFGHTSGKGIRRIEDSYCIDCLDSDQAGFLELDL